jgi:hypothetical protein
MRLNNRLKTHALNTKPKTRRRDGSCAQNLFLVATIRSRWRILRPATPINPRSPTVNILKRDHTTVPSPTALSDPPASSYSLSVITPPAVTKHLLKEAKEAGVPAVWLQPGSFDREVLEYAQANFKAAIGGNGGGGGEGWCVLVDGEAGLRLAEREWSRL